MATSGSQDSVDTLLSALRIGFNTAINMPWRVRTKAHKSTNVARRLRSKSCRPWPRSRGTMNIATPASAATAMLSPAVVFHRGNVSELFRLRPVGRSCLSSGQKRSIVGLRLLS